MAAPPDPGMIVQGRRFLSPAEALPLLLGGAVLVDLRSDQLREMKAFLVPEVVSLPHPVDPARARTLPGDRLLILADSSGVYTRPAAAVLEALGFGQLACLNGGMLAWDQAGLPLATDPATLLQGDCACVLRSQRDRAAAKPATP